MKYVLGLSATVVRKDGHHPIIFMQCGPVRFRADARQQAEQRPFGHRVILRSTDFSLPPDMDAKQYPNRGFGVKLSSDCQVSWRP